MAYQSKLATIDPSPSTYTNVHTRNTPTPPVNMDVPCLTNPMTAILRLCIHRGVPVRVVEDDCVCSGQVNPQTTTACRQDETEYPFVTVESLHQLLERG